MTVPGSGQMIDGERAEAADRDSDLAAAVAGEKLA